MPAVPCCGALPDREKDSLVTPARVVFITASNLSEARRLTQGLLKEKLAACVTIVPRVESRYWWKGKIERASESLLVAKTRAGCLKALIAKIRALHSYTVPEIVALPVISGHKDYLRWIDASVKHSAKRSKGTMRRVSSSPQVPSKRN